MIRVVIADDHAVLRAGLRLLIDAQADMEVVGEAANGAEALRVLGETTPDVLVLDLTMPEADGLHVLADVSQVSPKTRALVLTMHDDPAYVRAMLAAGAAGYVVKRVADTELLTAIRAIAEGRMFVDAHCSVQTSLTLNQPLSEKTNDLLQHLSQRESEVLKLVARGHTNQEVAVRLGISVKTVETYRLRLMEKLRLRTRAELVCFAVEHGFLAREVVRDSPSA